MKTVEITEASLADYGRHGQDDTWVLTRRGRPVAALIPIRSGVDLESYRLSHNPEFIEIINRSWASYTATGGVSLKDMRRKYRIKGPRPRPRKAR